MMGGVPVRPTRRGSCNDPEMVQPRWPTWSSNPNEKHRDLGSNAAKTGKPRPFVVSRLGHAGRKPDGRRSSSKGVPTPAYQRHVSRDKKKEDYRGVAGHPRFFFHFPLVHAHLFLLCSRPFSSVIPECPQRVLGLSPLRVKRNHPHPGEPAANNRPERHAPLLWWLLCGSANARRKKPRGKTKQTRPPQGLRSI